MTWKPIKTLSPDLPEHPCPKREIDVWAKRWKSKDDSWEYQRFTDIRRNGVGELLGGHNRAEGWSATHWMFAPEAPKPPRAK